MTSDLLVIGASTRGVEKILKLLLICLVHLILKIENSSSAMVWNLSIFRRQTFL